MTAASMESADRRRDIVFTTELRKGGGWRITANELAPPNGPVKTAARTVHTTKERVNMLKTANDGAIIVAVSGSKVLIGTLLDPEFNTVDKIKYQWRIFESSEYISSFDVQVLERTEFKDIRKSMRKVPVVNIVVGDVKGSIFVHTDLLAKLMLSQDGALPQGWSLIPKKMHWHRQDVLAVKWSRDGMWFPILFTVS